MIAAHHRPRWRKVAIGAALLAPLALLSARRAVQAAAFRRTERRGPLAGGRAATVPPTSAATSADVGAATAGVEPVSVARTAGGQATQPEKPSAAEPRKRKGRTPRLILAAASVALIGAFIQHAQSRVLRPSLVLQRPTNGSPTTQAGLRSDEGLNNTAAVVRSGTRASGQKLRQHLPTHQSQASLPSGRRPTQPVPPAKAATERPISAVRVVTGRAGHGLRWNAVAGATYYDLVIWRDRKRVLDLWPASPRVVVPTTSVNREPQARLSPGRYLWFVYPGLGAKPAHQYGALVASGVLVVQPKGGK